MPVYSYGLDPCHFVEIPDTGTAGQVVRPDIGAVVTVVDAETLSAVTGLMDGDSNPISEVVTLSYGYVDFKCESPSVLVTADGINVKRLWGVEAIDDAIANAIAPAAYDPVVIVTYNDDGTVATYTEGSVVTTYAYNPDGTVASHVKTQSGVTLSTRTYTYDDEGNLTGVS